MSQIASILFYIIDFLGKIYIYIVLLRFLLQFTRADFYNPISQFVVKVTHPLLRPLRKIIPSIGRQDTSSLLLAYLLTIVALALQLMVMGILLQVPVTSLLLGAFIKFITIIVDLIFLIFIGNVILSWIAPDSRSPAAMLIRHICDFLLAPLRRIIPPLGIFDITPMVALLLLYFMHYLIVQAFAPF